MEAKNESQQAEIGCWSIFGSDRLHVWFVPCIHQRFKPYLKAYESIDPMQENIVSVNFRREALWLLVDWGNDDLVPSFVMPLKLWWLQWVNDSSRAVWTNRFYSYLPIWWRTRHFCVGSAPMTTVYHCHSQMKATFYFSSTANIRLTRLSSSVGWWSGILLRRLYLPPTPPLMDCGYETDDDSYNSDYDPHSRIDSNDDVPGSVSLVSRILRFHGWY